MLEILLFTLLIALAIFAIFALLPDDRARGFAALRREEYARAFSILKPYADRRQDASAQAAIGLLYHTGRGVDPDARTALRYYEQAYEGGIDRLAAMIGKMYLQGEGARIDEKRALEWLMKAARREHPEAMRLLGDAYSDANGTLQDFVQAHRWYNLAAAAGDKVAKTRLKRLSEQMTPEQIKSAQALAKPEAARSAPEAAAKRPE